MGVALDLEDLIDKELISHRQDDDII